MRDLLRLALAHLRGSWQRATVAAAAVFVAVASFVVLTGTVTTQQLQVTRTVEDNYRSTYDILVRPRASAEALERSGGLVRPNFLSGSYGGIQLDQVRRIAAVPGVEIAAPVAVLGQTMRNILVPVDVGDVLRDRDHAMVRYSLMGSSRHGTGRTSNQHGFVYLTKSPLVSRGGSDTTSPGLVEKRAGSSVVACLPGTWDAGGNSPAQSFVEQCWSSRTPGNSRPRIEFLISIPLTVEAVDPVAEAQLTGLNQAVVAGRGLTAADGAAVDRSGPAAVVMAKALMASGLPFDHQATVTVEEMSETTTQQVLATRDAAARRAVVLAAKPLRTLTTVTRDAARTYRQELATLPPPGAGASPDESLFVESLIQPGDVKYSSTDPLRPRTVPFDAGAWRAEEGGPFVPSPTTVTDTGYRAITGQPRTDTSTFVGFDVVGTFDADRLPRPSRLNEVPLETYRASPLLGADPASRGVLGDQPMRPDLNPAGYAQSPPALLVSLKALPSFWKSFSGLNRSAPVSSVRVRVAGIHGLDPVAREKIRQVAQTIESRTGLQVDVTIGASLQNRRVALPATASGTPALALEERWTKKGVAVAISQALDAKSLVLVIVILVSSALTVGLVTTATVAARRRELATLVCVGWTQARLGGLLAAELAVLGLGSGGCAAVVSWPLARALGIEVTCWQVVPSVPLGAALALLPGLVATVRAGRTSPMDAFRPRVRRGRRRARLALTGPAALGLILTVDRRGRAVVGGVAVALAVASALALAVIVRVFNGAVVGSFLGDAVALQVRGPDVAATVVLIVLGLVAVATVLLLGLVEDAPFFATLRAIGWSEAALNTALVTQAAAVGLGGGVLGVAIALGGAVVLLGALTKGIVLMAMAGVLAAVALAVTASVFPGLLLSRLPTARVLTRE